MPTENKLKIKSCSRCGQVFECGDNTANGGCWCNRYPPLLTPDPAINCMCQPCLHTTMKQKIDAYVREMTPAKALTNNPAALLPATKHYIAGIDYYTENSNWVFTAWHHLKRGYCCKNGCRHCPYGFDKSKPL